MVLSKEDKKEYDAKRYEKFKEKFKKETMLIFFLYKKVWILSLSALQDQ